MVKRKDADDIWEKDELAVPIPIQIFLWRQSSPFIRPKLGKLHEATCLEILKRRKREITQEISFKISSDESRAKSFKVSLLIAFEIIPFEGPFMEGHLSLNDQVYNGLGP